MVVDEAEIRQQAKKKIEKTKYPWKKLESDVPPGVEVKDVLTSVDVIPLEELITANGSLQRRDVIIRRCIKHLAEEGKVDEAKLRNVTSNKLYNILRRQWVADDIEKKNAMTVIRETIPVVELVYTYDGEELNLGKIFNLVNKYVHFKPHLKNYYNK